MQGVQFEPFVHLAEVTPRSALVAWGGFFFEEGDDGRQHLLHGQALEAAGLGRSQSIGAGSEPYGSAHVVVRTRSGQIAGEARTDQANHVWVEGLSPDTWYEYEVRVDGEPWAADDRLDWSLEEGRVTPCGRRYARRFRTHPDPERSGPVRFAVMGDFGVGARGATSAGLRQRAVARTLEHAVSHRDIRFIVTVGDNVYQSRKGERDGEGSPEEEWYYAFYQPYRYILDRIPIYPSVGNHDAEDATHSDDRTQLAAHFHLLERLRHSLDGAEAVDPALYYRLRIGSDLELVCIDTSRPGDEHRRAVADPGHRRFLDRVFSAEAEPSRRPSWRIPFGHHPPYCAGPHHGNTAILVEQVVPLFRRADVRVALAGHEHNFQYGTVDGIHYFITGAAGSLRTDAPTDFGRAGTRAWAAVPHFLIVETHPDRVRVQPVMPATVEQRLLDPRGRPYPAPIEINR